MSLKKVEKCLLAGHPSTIQILFFGVEKISILHAAAAEIWSIENGTVRGEGEEDRDCHIFKRTLLHLLCCP